MLLETRETIGHEVKWHRGRHRPYFVSSVNPFFILLYFIRKKTIYSFVILVYLLQIIQDTLYFRTISAKKVGNVSVRSQMLAPGFMKTHYSYEMNSLNVLPGNRMG